MSSYFKSEYIAWASVRSEIWEKKTNPSERMLAKFTCIIKSILLICLETLSEHPNPQRLWRMAFQRRPQGNLPDDSLQALPHLGLQKDLLSRIRHMYCISTLATAGHQVVHKGINPPVKEYTGKTTKNHQLLITMYSNKVKCLLLARVPISSLAVGISASLCDRSWSYLGRFF